MQQHGSNNSLLPLAAAFLLLVCMPACLTFACCDDRSRVSCQVHPAQEALAVGPWASWSIHGMITMSIAEHHQAFNVATLLQN